MACGQCRFTRCSKLRKSVTAKRESETTALSLALLTELPCYQALVSGCLLQTQDVASQPASGLRGCPAWQVAR
jgi:hypothetical protein